MAFAEMVVVDHLSFSFAEKLGFNKWIKEHCQPAYKPIVGPNSKPRGGVNWFLKIKIRFVRINKTEIKLAK